MSFSRIRPPGLWTHNSVLLPAEAETIDANLAKAMDGTGGGAYAPSAVISVGGKGIQDASQIEFDVPSGTNDYYPDATDYHRISIKNGSNVASSIDISIAAAANGAHRSIFIDFLRVGVYLSINDGDVFNLTLPYDLKRARMDLECINGQWVMVHLSREPLLTTSADVTGTVTSPYTITKDYTRVLTALAGPGEYRFNLPAAPFAESTSQTIRVYFSSVSSVDLAFGLVGVTDPFYRVSLSGTGEKYINFALDFKSVNGSWFSSGITSLPRYRTMLTNPPIASGSYDPNLYSGMVIDTLDGDVVNSYILNDGSNEYDEFSVFVRSWVSTDGRLWMRNQSGLTIGEHISTTTFVNGCVTLRWFGGRWNWMGFSH